MFGLHGSRNIVFQSDSKLFLLFFFLFKFPKEYFFPTKEDQFQYFKLLDIVFLKSMKKGKREREGKKRRKTYK